MTENPRGMGTEQKDCESSGKGLASPSISTQSSEILVPLKEKINPEGYRTVEGSWGYACFVDNKIWIPAISGDMKAIVSMLVNHFKTNKVVFSAIINPIEFKKHLKNIVREWDDWFEQAQDYTHCIEVEWI